MLNSEKHSLYINTDYDIVEISGKDAFDLIERITTNNISKLSTNNFLSTIFLNEKGRIVDIFETMKLNDSLFGISSNAEKLNEWIDKFVFTEDINIKKSDYTYCDVVLADGNTILLDSQLSAGKVNLLQYKGFEIYAFVEY